jgi:hypothetical protein
VRHVSWMLRTIAAALLLATACATAPRAGSTACPRGWAGVEAALHAGLARYQDGISRYVAATIPGGDTAPGRARAAAAAERWSAAHREPFLARCASAGPELASCAAAAGMPEDLHACGLSAEVRSFSDEVLPAFAADPLGRAVPEQ